MSRLNPGALSVADAARVLSRLGGKPVTEDMLRADIDAGAPTNADGTLNLVHYAAWLVRQSGVWSPESAAGQAATDAATRAGVSTTSDSRLRTPGHAS
ncbi:MAG: hypothetical protein ACK4WH_13425 [Phycisphaerales bacterium]